LKNIYTFIIDKRYRLAAQLIKRTLDIPSPLRYNIRTPSGCGAVGSAGGLGACRAFNALKNKKPQNPCIHTGFGHL